MHTSEISRRSFLHALLGCATVSALAACGASSSSSSSGETAPSQPILSADECPVLDGSTACIPLLAQMLSDTTGLELEEAQSCISVSTTAYAWRRIALWDTEEPMLLVVYEAPDSVKEEIAQSGVALEQKPVGRDALVFIVNENNPVKSLTRRQLLDIYSGKITNWKEVGGDDIEIIPFQRSEDSGSQTLFRKLLIQDNPLMEAPTELAPAEMGMLVDSVAAYNNSANAIGFSVYYYISQMYSQPGLRLIAVDDVTPSSETIGNQTYPLCNEFYAVIRADAEADSPERTLYDWLSTDAGHRCIETSGYVPVV